MIKYKIVFFSLFLTGLINWAQANTQCLSLFKHDLKATVSATIIKTEVQSLDSLGKAMTEGMMLHPEQGDVHDLYRKHFLGDPKSSKYNQSLKQITEVLKKYPNLTKKLFPEYEIRSVEKIYETPEIIDKFIKSQITTTGQIRNNLYNLKKKEIPNINQASKSLFQFEANLIFWKKVLDYKDPIMPESLKPLNLGKDSTEQERARARIINEARSEFQDKSQKRFINYLIRIFDKSNSNLLTDLNNDHLDYVQKAKSLYETLKYIESWMSQKGRDTQAIRQAMFDIVFYIGYGNQSTVNLLKSESAMDKIQGLRQLWIEANAFAETLKYAGHIAELKIALNIEFPTGLPKNADYLEMIREFEKEVIKSPYTTKPTNVIRVRSLSIQESPFRSDLGKCCSTNTYFEIALDPNYIYFTMTDVSYRSDGQATVVLGTAKNKQTGVEENVAFLDKLQNIPAIKIENFLDAVNRSLQEEGYQLAIPTDLGKHISGHGGLSNTNDITDFVQLNIMTRLNDVRSEFTPHPHDYKFQNKYSRADQRLEVQLYRAKDLDPDTEIQRGKHFLPYLADKSLDKKSLAQEYLNLRNSDKEEDLLRFIKSGEFVNQLEAIGVYNRSDYLADIESILNRANTSFNIRKTAFFQIILSIKDSSKFIQSNLNKFIFDELQMIKSEVIQWENSTNSMKQQKYEYLLQSINSTLSSTIHLKRIQELERILINNGLTFKEKKNAFLELLLLSRNPELLFERYLNQFTKSEFKEIYGAIRNWKNSSDVNMKEMYKLLKLRDNEKLMNAYQLNDINTIKQLLEDSFVDINFQDSKGNTLFILILAEQKISSAKFELLKILLDRTDLDVNLKNENGDSLAQQFIVRHYMFPNSSITRNMAAELGSKFLEKVDLIDVKQKNKQGRSFLDFLVENPWNELIMAILKSPNVPTTEKTNLAIFNAFKAIDHDSLKRLKASFVVPEIIDINIKNQYGETLLMTAAKFGEKDIVMFLLEQPQIDTSLKSDRGDTAEQIASKKGHKSIALMIKFHGIKNYFSNLF